MTKEPDLNPNPHPFYSEAQQLSLFSLQAIHGTIENSLTPNSILAITGTSPFPNRKVTMVIRTLIFISLPGSSPQLQNILGSGNKTESNSSYSVDFYLLVFWCIDDL